VSFRYAIDDALRSIEKFSKSLLILCDLNLLEKDKRRKGRQMCREPHPASLAGRKYAAIAQ
jgi:hypothetical protein